MQGRGGAQAEVWYAWVGHHAADVGRYSDEFLSKDECDRLGSYRSRAAAERFVVTRSLIRLVLSRRIGVAPRDLAVSRTGSGKPVVEQGIHFNVSHSGDLILLAVSEQRAVGVDVERRRDIARVEALAARWLTPDEGQSLQQLVSAGRSFSDAFLRIWSLKEARLKALGVGIVGAAGADLTTVEALALDQLLETLVAGRDDPGYVGALAFA